jgi:hypothetical protein
LRPLALLLALSVLALTSPATAALDLTVDDVKTAVADRAAELDALPAPDKAQKKEGKSLAKALKALALYTGTDDKTDLKKALAKAVKYLEKAASADPNAGDWIPALWRILTDATDAAADEAAGVRDALSTEKNRTKATKLVGKCDAVRSKAEGLAATSHGKAANVLVKAILKYRKAWAKASKMLAKEDPGPGPATLDRSALAIVLSPDGDPVPNAVVGGGPITNGDGVAVGPVTVTAGGWVEVVAHGHAAGYAEDGPALNGSRLYMARVTPIEGLLHLTTGGSGDLTAGGEGRLLTSVLDAADFASLPVTVGLAEIDPLDVGPVAVPLAGHADLVLRRALAFTAHAPDGSPVGFGAGITMAVTVEDGGALGDSPVLARFDPATGAWVEVVGGVTRTGPDHLRCDLATPAPLYGLFAPEAGSGKMLTEFEAELALKIARVALAKAVRDSISPTTDPAVTAALDTVAAAARDLADVSPDEKGKFALLMAATDARTLQKDALADELEDEALALAEFIALSYMTTNECGVVEKMYAAAAQVDMLGGSSTVVDQLLDKVGELRAECGRWVGTINFRMNVSRTHPGLENFTLVSGGGSWREDHFVVIDVDPDTGFVLVKDRVQHFLFYVMYQDMTQECPNYMSFYGEPISAVLEFAYAGSWSEQGGFQVGPATLTAGSPPSISWKQHFEDKEDETCVVLPFGDMLYTFPNHTSLMAHGLWDLTPVVTLQEILNSGGAATGQITGGMPLVNPMPEGGKYPFTWGTVSWSLTRVR